MNVSTDGVREEGAWEMLPPLLLKTLEAWPGKSVKANLLASLGEVVVMKRNVSEKATPRGNTLEGTLGALATGTAQRKGVWKDPNLDRGGQFRRCREEAPFIS